MSTIAAAKTGAPRVTVYRGKHPARIESVFTMDPTHPQAHGFRYGFRTNAGRVYGLRPQPGQLPPRLGQETGEVLDACFLYQSDKRRGVS